MISIVFLVRALPPSGSRQWLATLYKVHGGEACTTSKVPLAQILKSYSHMSVQMLGLSFGHRSIDTTCHPSSLATAPNDPVPLKSSSNFILITASVLRGRRFFVALVVWVRP
jgi:hypothetical protein